MKPYIVYIYGNEHELMAQDKTQKKIKYERTGSKMSEKKN